MGYLEIRIHLDTSIICCQFAANRKVFLVFYCERVSAKIVKKKRTLVLQCLFWTEVKCESEIWEEIPCSHCVDKTTSLSKNE